MNVEEIEAIKKQAHREMSEKGGKNSRKNMTEEQATALAKEAAKARWKNHRKQKEAAA